MKKLVILILLLHATLTAGIPIQQEFYGPSEQLTKRESWNRIQKKLDKLKIPKNLYPFFKSITATEEWGHVGYHGAEQSYRVYQDIIRYTVEELIGIQVREDFQFLRIPGDTQLNLNSIAEFNDYWGSKIDNKSEKRAKQLLSMNFGLYSNYDEEGSCSLKLFVKDESKNDINFIKQLTPFYGKLGIAPSELKNLFAIANKRLNGEGGILLRLSENSHLTDPFHEAYNFADAQCYPAKRGGYQWGMSPISVHFQRILSENYINRKTEIAPQLRLLINNRYTLNPYSHLCIKRWDLYDQETISLYEQEMRSHIRNLKFDAKKATEYRNTLLDTWL